MYVLLQSHDIGQGMNLLPIEGADVVTETLENGQYGRRIIKLDRWSWVAHYNVRSCSNAPYDFLRFWGSHERM